MTSSTQNPTGTPLDLDLKREVLSIWDANAEFWNERMGAEGNPTHRRILVPALKKLLGLRAGEEVLEIACGNGQLARWLSRQGAKVLATDGSEEMLKHARAAGQDREGTLEFRHMDAMDAKALRTLGTGRFPLVICNMALMDIPDIEPLARALPRLLAPSGRFVATVTHPVFNATGSRKVLEEEEEIRGTTPALSQRSGVLVNRYLTQTASRGLAIRGQPRSQYYFDRTLTGLLRPFLATGLVLDAFEELASPPDMKGDYPFSWVNFPEITPFLAVRFRKVK